MSRKNDHLCGDFLRELEKKIPDCLLISYFPYQKPQEIREMLLATADHLAPVEKKSSEDVLQDRQIQTKPGLISIYTDGASRGNPGEAGAGFVIFNEENDEIATGSKYLGQCTNNVAEYQALILGLKEAGKIGNRQISIFLDSQLIVRQIQGKYKVKNVGLKPLFAEVRRLLDQFDSFQVSHVPRNLNKRADELANQGIDDRR
ncbi:MAG: ribonuclease HI family protein [Thermodesulfobacteriota bacterium]|nr:ribonuclease HI family protein [Thermodesulfobacteriota bacterium]